VGLASRQGVEISLGGDEVNGYVCFWNGERCEVHAETMFAAKDKAIAEFQRQAGRKRVKGHMVSVVLGERDGEQVVHDPAILD